MRKFFPGPDKRSWLQTATDIGKYATYDHAWRAMHRTGRDAVRAAMRRNNDFLAKLDADYVAPTTEHIVMDLHRSAQRFPLDPTKLPPVFGADKARFIRSIVTFNKIHANNILPEIMEKMSKLVSNFIGTAVVNVANHTLRAGELVTFIDTLVPLMPHSDPLTSRSAVRTAGIAFKRLKECIPGQNTPEVDPRLYNMLRQSVLYRAQFWPLVLREDIRRSIGPKQREPLPGFIAWSLHKATDFLRPAVNRMSAIKARTVAIFGKPTAAPAAAPQPTEVVCTYHGFNAAGEPISFSTKDLDALPELMAAARGETTPAHVAVAKTATNG